MGMTKQEHKNWRETNPKAWLQHNKNVSETRKKLFREGKIIHPRGMLGKQHSEDTKRKFRGRKVWNKGLTKETDEKVKKYGISQSLTKKDNKKFERISFRNLKKGNLIKHNSKLLSDISKTEANLLFKRWKISNEPLSCFSKKNGIHKDFLSKLFKKFFPKKYLQIRKKFYSKDFYGNRTENIDEEIARELFEKYKKSKVSLQEFHRKYKKELKISRENLRMIFKKYFPADYDNYFEKRQGSAYKRGVNFEYRTKNILKNLNYFVTRSPRSQGFADLVAIKKGEILLIQCKMNKNSLSRKEKEGLILLAKGIGALPLMAYRNDDRHIEFLRLDTLEIMDKFSYLKEKKKRQRTD